MKIFATMMVVILAGALAFGQTGGGTTNGGSKGVERPADKKGKKSKEDPKEHKGGHQEKKAGEKKS
jgi:hypothetical protein